MEKYQSRILIYFYARSGFEYLCDTEEFPALAAKIAAMICCAFYEDTVAKLVRARAGRTDAAEPDVRGIREALQKEWKSEKDEYDKEVAAGNRHPGFKKSYFHAALELGCEWAPPAAPRHRARFERLFERLASMQPGTSRFKIVCFSGDDPVEVVNSSGNWSFSNGVNLAYEKTFPEAEKNLKPSADGEYPEWSYAGDAVLSKSSRRRTEQFRPGNALFWHPDKGLVSTGGEQCVPVGVCAGEATVGSDGRWQAVFVPYGNCSLASPDYGGRNLEQFCFCASDFTLKQNGCPDVPATSGYDGTKATSALYRYAAFVMRSVGACDPNWRRGILSGTPDPGFFPALASVARFRTAGTRPGQWYIPSEIEMENLMERRESVDRTRCEVGPSRYGTPESLTSLDGGDYFMTSTVEKPGDGNIATLDMYSVLDGMTRPCPLITRAALVPFLRVHEP